LKCTKNKKKKNGLKNTNQNKQQFTGFWGVWEYSNSNNYFLKCFFKKYIKIIYIFNKIISKITTSKQSKNIKNKLILNKKK
jgi:hypothetical protein